MSWLLSLKIDFTYSDSGVNIGSLGQFWQSPNDPFSAKWSVKDHSAREILNYSSAWTICHSKIWQSQTNGCWQPVPV